MTIQEAKDKLIRWAVDQTGYHEGDNNWNKYAAIVEPLYNWLPQNQPWCDVFVDAGFISCFGLQLASKLTYQPVGKGSAACRYSAGFYSAHEAFYQAPEVGDQIFFYYDDGINHTGIVTAVSGGIVYTIEGNTSDMVARRAYSIGSNIIAGYGRPNWPVVLGEDAPEDPPAQEDPPENPTVKSTYDLPMLQKGDKGEVVKAMKALLILRGYKGNFKSSNPNFGVNVEKAVLRLQKAKALEQDGIVGPQTWAALLGL